MITAYRYTWPEGGDARRRLSARLSVPQYRPRIGFTLTVSVERVVGGLGLTPGMFWGLAGFAKSRWRKGFAPELPAPCRDGLGPRQLGGSTAWTATALCPLVYQLARRGPRRSAAGGTASGAAARLRVADPGLRQSFVVAVVLTTLYSLRSTAGPGVPRRFVHASEPVKS
jgi:hypothetical protein